jgi:hypothetical protein
MLLGLVDEGGEYNGGRWVSNSIPGRRPAGGKSKNSLAPFSMGCRFRLMKDPRLDNQL